MIFNEQGTKRNCGQIAVASLLNQTVEHIETLVGHSHGTTTRELSAAIRKLGFHCSRRCKVWNQKAPLPQMCIAQLHVDGKSGWHWVAIAHGIVADGQLAKLVSLKKYMDDSWLLGYRLTSFLEVVR